MSEISAKQVMMLRNKTGLSMMECKKALVEVNGDIDAAEDLLKKKLKGKMDTRTDRAAGEGCIAIAVNGDQAAIIELRAETDFTAKNDTFVNAAQKLAEAALAKGNGAVEADDSMKSSIDELRISTGENISLARALKRSGGSFGTYIHHDRKTGVLLNFTGDVSDEVARDICMHITAAVPRPAGVSRDDVPDSVIEKERRLAIEMAKESGKNQEIAEKMVEGKINKLYSELALLEQIFVKDGATKISDLLPAGATVKSFDRWQVGEATD
ncbi:MAG: translation elongation factor Ts [Phycisphaerales bacterium]|nr:translation elongation factor Ts [Phycisphaerales bacterium]